MGVRGLSTFFDQNLEFFKPYKLHDCLVIFDGDNLIHALYFNYRVNFMYGGDYKKYADSIKRYFVPYLQCNIKPIVIFDGGFDKSGRKLKTIVERHRKRISEVEYIAKHGSSSGKVLPLLAWEVFISVLVELDIAFAVCDYEADDQITALANHYECPVISADSDFYIFDLHRGFINIRSIDTTVVLETDSAGKEYKFLNCNLYHIDEFVSCFPGIDKSVLPLFGTLMGNDYVQAKEFDNFFSNIKLPKYRGRKLILNPRQKKMAGLLCWLKNNTLDEAVNQVLQHLKKDRRERVESTILNAVGSYELRHCDLSSIVDEKLYGVKREMCSSSRLTTPCGRPLPSDFIVKFHSGRYCSFFINAIVSHRVFLPPQVEDVSFPTSFACSRFIRQILYGILTRHDGTCADGECLAFIEETDRQRRERVPPISSLEGFGLLPTLDDLGGLAEERSKLILSKALGVGLEFFSDLPEEWQLLIGCTNYCLRNCLPYFTEYFIHALIINLIYFSLMKHKRLDRDRFLCPARKTGEVDCSCTSIACLLSRIGEPELKRAETNLEKYVHKSSFNHGNPLILHVVHSYSQLQTCVLSGVALNKLLGSCFRQPELHRCLGGTMLYNLAKDIEKRPDPPLFAAQILGRESHLHLLFTQLDSKVWQDVPPERILKSVPRKHKKKSKKSSDAGAEGAPVNKFDALDSAQLL